MLKTLYPLLIIGLLFVVSCKRLSREQVNLHINTSETLVGMSADPNYVNRFDSYSQSEFLTAVCDDLERKIDGRSINVVGRMDQADYVLWVDEVTLDDWVELEVYDNECSPNNEDVLEVCNSTITMYGAVHNVATDVSTSWSLSRHYKDKVDSCPGEDGGCPHNDVNPVTSQKALRKYSRQSARSVKRAVWADQDAQ